MPESSENKGTGNENSFIIAFAGDILFDPAYTAGRKATSRGVAGSYDEKALERMRGEDVFIVNNEFTYTRGGKRSGKTYAFRTDPRYAAMLQEMGVDLVTQQPHLGLRRTGIPGYPLHAGTDRDPVYRRRTESRGGFAA